jgi:hypothetical protein
MKAMVLLLTIMMMITSTVCVVDARHLKYSELVNVSIEDFTASMNNNVSALLHDLELANEVHDYDAIVNTADLIEQNQSQFYDLIDDFQREDLHEQRASLYPFSFSIFGMLYSGNPTFEIIQDARKRVKERNADIADQEKERIRKEAENAGKSGEWLEKYGIGSTKLVEDLDKSKETLERIESTTSSIPNKGFGNYTFDGQDKVKVSVKKGTDLIHMMAMEELPTDYGYTKDSAEYTVTSTGKKIKGYLDYTLDGYVVVMQPRRSSLTKGEFMDILDTFERVD